MTQPFDPLFPTGRGGSGGPPSTGEEERKKRILWSQSRTFTIHPGGPETVLMTLPASTAIDCLVQYRQPGANPTIVSPDGREVYNLYAGEQLFTRILASFNPGGHTPGGGGNSLPQVGRIFAVRDFPADSWELKIDTTLMVPDPDAPPNLVIDVICQGWAREPTGIGPRELETLAAGEEQTDSLVVFAATGGLTDVNVPAFAIVPVFDLVDPWSPSNGDLAGAENVIITAVASDGETLTPVVLTPDGALPSAEPASLTNWTEALAGSLVVRNRGCLAEGVSGRIDATATDGTYYVQLWNLDAVPANATNFTKANGGIAAPHKINHVSGTDDEFEIDIPNGFGADTGFTITLSTTEFVKSASPGNFMSATGYFRDGDF